MARVSLSCMVSLTRLVVLLLLDQTPFPNYFALGADVAYFASHNVSGLFEQGASWTPGGELNVLKDYIVGRTMLEPQLDRNALINGFLVNYFGPAAAPHVLEYMQTLHNATAGYYMYDNLPVTAAFLTPHAVIYAAAALEAGRAATIKSSSSSAAVSATKKFVERLDTLKLHVYYVALRRYMEMRIAWATGTPWPFGNGTDQCKPCSLAAGGCEANEPFCERAAFDEFRRIFVSNGWQNRTSFNFEGPAAIEGFPVAVLGDMTNTSACNVDCFGEKLFMNYQWPPKIKTDDQPLLLNEADFASALDSEPAVPKHVKVMTACGYNVTTQGTGGWQSFAKSRNLQQLLDGYAQHGLKGMYRVDNPDYTNIACSKTNTCAPYAAHGRGNICAFRAPGPHENATSARHGGIRLCSKAAGDRTDWDTNMRAVVRTQPQCLLSEHHLQPMVCMT
eukprot:SAG22_NODE_949_length_6356_cov_2.100527_1_plen_448_part_00